MRLIGEKTYQRLRNMILDIALDAWFELVTAAKTAKAEATKVQAVEHWHQSLLSPQAADGDGDTLTQLEQALETVPVHIGQQLASLNAWRSKNLTLWVEGCVRNAQTTLCRYCINVWATVVLQSVLWRGLHRRHLLLHAVSAWMNRVIFTRTHAHHQLLQADFDSRMTAISSFVAPDVPRTSGLLILSLFKS